MAADRMFHRLCQGKYGPMSTEAMEILQSMQENNQELLTLTNTLLAVYRYESGIQALSFTEFNLSVLINSVISELQPLAKEKKLQLRVSGSPNDVRSSQTWMIEGVKLELRTAFMNLIGNALKFTDQGWIKIHLIPNGNGYEIRIQDTGSGIVPQDLPHIFERFYQGRHHRSGTGLGLNLVWQIVVAHQGRIEATSQLGEGTCFTVWLPRCQNPSDPSTES
ncbi:MAG: HAMP domain-containing histidine kinase [Acaryochloridaceae cyanobacterium RL_2_7]|nr:HAMP domain-containing histidine kinase [Acaryochloridaceae cyanobacterium RL_2_7]